MPIMQPSISDSDDLHHPHDDPTARAKALKSGAVDLLRKPFAAEALLNTIQEAVDRRVST